MEQQLVEVEKVGESSEIISSKLLTVLGLEVHRLLCSDKLNAGMSDKSSIGWTEYKQMKVEYRAKERADWKALDVLKVELDDMFFYGKGSEEMVGKLLCENKNMNFCGEHWKVYFHEKEETKSGKCVKGKMFVRKQIPKGEEDGNEIVEYVESKIKVMIPKSVLAKEDKMKTFWWIYYNAIQKNSLRPWE